MRDLDRHQNLIICSLANCQPSLKISCKSIWKFLCKVADKHTNNDDYITSLAEVKNRMRMICILEPWTESNRCIVSMKRNRQSCGLCQIINRAIFDDREWSSRSCTYCRHSGMWSLVQLCSIWQNVNWHSASRGASFLFNLPSWVSRAGWAGSTNNLTSGSAIAERPRDARVTSIRKIAKWNFWATLLGDNWTF